MSGGGIFVREMGFDLFRPSGVWDAWEVCFGVAGYQ